MYTVVSWQERKRCEESQRNAQAQAAEAADAAKRCERLAAEVADLQATLEQKQELITALQVTIQLPRVTWFGVHREGCMLSTGNC